MSERYNDASAEMKTINFRGQSGKENRRNYIKTCLLEGLQDKHTPFLLCKEMLDKLKENIGENRNIEEMEFCVLFNTEFVEMLISDYGIKPDKITFLADSQIELWWIYTAYGLNIINYMRQPFLIDLKNCDKEQIKNWSDIFMGKKFDVVIGNPPYQSDSGNKGSNNILWDKFVEKSFNDLVKEDGYVALVHPSGWRKPGHKIWNLLNKKNIEYIEVHNENDGIKTFGAATRYDWYVVQNKENEVKETIVKDEMGTEHVMDLKKLGFLPNYMIDEISRLIEEDESKRVKIIKDCAYHTHNHNKNGIKVSKVKTDTCIYPCVYSVNIKDEPRFCWSSFNNRGHFGTPKVIFGSGSTGFYNDKDGCFGQTQFARSIVDDVENLESIIKALKSDKFGKIIKAISVGAAEINVDVLKLFRKDFWKEFV